TPEGGDREHRLPAARLPRTLLPARLWRWRIRGSHPLVIRPPGEGQQLPADLPVRHATDLCVHSLVSLLASTLLCTANGCPARYDGSSRLELMAVGPWYHSRRRLPECPRRLRVLSGLGTLVDFAGTPPLRARDAHLCGQCLHRDRVRPLSLCRGCGRRICGELSGASRHNRPQPDERTLP